DYTPEQLAELLKGVKTQNIVLYSCRTGIPIPIIGSYADRFKTALREGKISADANVVAPLGPIQDKTDSVGMSRTDKMDERIAEMKEDLELRVETYRSTLDDPEASFEEMS